MSIDTRSWGSALSLTDSFVLWLLAAGALAIFLGLLGWLARGASVNATLVRSTSPTTGQRTLLVMVHGMGGYRRFQSAVRLAMQALPLADVLCLHYRCSWITNLSPYTVADVLEEAIYQRFKQGQYGEIVMVGHSAGAAIARKAFLWGSGFEEDRPRKTPPRVWPATVSRIVMLAGLSRGIRLWPRPENRSWAERLRVFLRPAEPGTRLALFLA